MELREKVLGILEEICEDSAVREETDIDLFENGLLDSVAIVELLVAIEDNFGLVLSPTELTREDIKTPERIIELIQARS